MPGWKLALVALLAAAILGCARNNPPALAPVATGPDPAVLETLSEDNQRLQETVAAQERQLSEKDALIGRLQLQLLERDARYRAIEGQISSQQDRLDEAVVEVVRTKAKLRSIESRAEAASSIAEAEIALKGLKDRMEAIEVNPGDDVQKAEALVRMSTSEFKKENYGGALYLAGQAQSQIRAIESRLVRPEDQSAVPGEVLFALPLPLKVVKRSNLRQGPSLQAKIERTLDTDEPIIGYSYKEEWIRVQTEDGIRGWIFQTLVSER
jgi:hypothetical protein